jgi:hypothetical protein
LKDGGRVTRFGEIFPLGQNYFRFAVSISTKCWPFG